jgi:hypothetical protein
MNIPRFVIRTDDSGNGYWIIDRHNPGQRRYFTSYEVATDVRNMMNDQEEVKPRTRLIAHLEV